MKRFITSLFLLAYPVAGFCSVQFSSKGIDKSGNCWAVSQTMKNDTSIIDATYFPYGSLAPTTFTLSDPQFFSDDAQIAVNENGDAVATWTSALNDARVLYASIFTSSGTGWSTPVAISALDENVLSGQRVKLSNTGQIVIAWNSYLTEQNQYIFSIIDGDITGTWYKSQRITSTP